MWLDGETRMQMGSTGWLQWGRLLMWMFLGACVASICTRAVATGSTDSLKGIYRTVRDPHTGFCWAVNRNTENPGGPGRMIQTLDEECARSRSIKYCFGVCGPEHNMQTPVIQSGDRLVVQESSPIVEVRLEAVALSPASLGAQFNARLTIGGRVIRAVALGAGRAELVRQKGVEP
jgi:hypothetical protein